MDNYFSQFNDKCIEQAFLHHEMVPILEKIIDNNMRIYSKLKDITLDYGEVPKRSDLHLLLEDVKIIVDTFFGVSKIKAPTVDYKRILERGLQFSDFSDFLMFFPSAYNILRSKGHYYDISEHISLKKEPRGSLIPVLAHEYTHHVQKHKFLFLPYLLEGQARSVQRHISGVYTERENNPTFLSHNLMHFDLPELKVAYLWLCQKHDIAPKIYLCQPQTKKEKQYLRIAEKFKEKNTKPNYHMMGNAFFSVLEFLEGKGIHRDIISEKYQLPSFF